MAEIIRALTEAVDKIGLVAVLIIAVTIGAFYVVRWNRALVDKLVEVNNAIGTLSNQTITRNTVAMNNNTESNLKVCSSIDGLAETQKEQTAYLRKFGSDPSKMCKIADLIAQSKAHGVLLTEEQAAIIVGQREKTK